ncbi:MAG TPA: TetR/AcrR family transcriptional regulator [Thermoanaerobaculia bacterium]|jgi:AcrR family transcriptional regulator
MAGDTKRGRGRPRREGTDQEILTISLAMLREKGYRDLTVDAIAERAGVAKTTVYRRWPSKGALVAFAVAPLAAAAAAPPDSGSLEADLTTLLTSTRDLLAGELGPIAAELIAESQHDPELIEIVRSIIAPRRQLFRAVLERGVSRGEMPGNQDLELVTDLLVGPLWARLLVSHMTTSGDLPALIVRSVLHGVTR